MRASSVAHSCAQLQIAKLRPVFYTVSLLIWAVVVVLVPATRSSNTTRVLTTLVVQYILDLALYEAPLLSVSSYTNVIEMTIIVL